MNNQPSNPKNEPNDDFWDLGDDDLELEKIPKADPVPPSPGPIPTEEDLDLPPADLELEAPVPASSAPAPEPAPEQKKVRVSSSSSESRPTSMLEKVSLALLVTIFAGVGYWGVTAFYDSAPNGEPMEFKEDFPAQGEQVTISSVETWWREPVRTGDDPDVGVVLGANLIPCAKIQLVESGSTTIQVSFRNGDDKLIGDTVNLTVENGKFTKSNSAEIDVHATSGFGEPTMMNAYVNEDIAPWSVAIVEEGGRSEDPLVRARIEANRKENK